MARGAAAESAGSAERQPRPLPQRPRRAQFGAICDERVRAAAYLAAHPALEWLCYLLLKKHRTRKQCERLTPRFLRASTNCARPAWRRSHRQTGVGLPHANQGMLWLLSLGCPVFGV